MKHLYKLLSITCIFALLFNTTLSAYALSNENKESQYIEYIEQIYFENIDVAVSDNEDIVLAVSEDVNIIEQIKAENDIEKFNAFTEKYPNYEQSLSLQLFEGDLYAISYTEAPLVYNEDHYERASSDLIKSEAGAKSESPGYFSLTTSIMRTGSANSAGEYLYTVMTTGEWSKNSILGGSKYPASGYDYVIQTAVPDFSLDTHVIVLLYNDDTYGEPGEDSHAETGGTNFVQYAIKDDPIGLRQLTEFMLVAQYYGLEKTSSRVIHSGYAHTWRTLSIDVELSANFDTNKTVGAGITIDPSLENKSWNVFSNVCFNF